MSVTLTAATDADALARSADRVAVRDPAGKLIGFFEPLPEFGMSDEEAIRMSDDPNTKWATPDEVMGRLRSLDGRQ